MTISIRSARVVDSANGLSQVGGLHIETGRIVTIGTAPADSSAQKTSDGAGLVAVPGLVDFSVVLREPDYGRKGNVESEARTAAAGGTTSLCCPSYTRLVLDTPAVAELILNRTREAGSARVYPISALTHGFGGEQLSELVVLRNTGCMASTDGLHGFTSNRILQRALEYAVTFDLTVIFASQGIDLVEGSLVHEGLIVSFLDLTGVLETTETVTLACNLLLMGQSGVRVHSSQLTNVHDTEFVAQAQTRGLPVTYDVAPYQLTLTDETLVGFFSLYRVQSPLHAKVDREALREVVKNGVVQVIASHRQPHETNAKNAPFAATEPGTSGAELLLPLAMTLMQDDLLDLPTLFVCLSHGPAQAPRLPARRLAVGQAADLVLFDPQGSTLASES